MVCSIKIFERIVWIVRKYFFENYKGFVLFWKIWGSKKLRVFLKKEGMFFLLLFFLIVPSSLASHHCYFTVSNHTTSYTTGYLDGTFATFQDCIDTANNALTTTNNLIHLQTENDDLHSQINELNLKLSELNFYKEQLNSFLQNALDLSLSLQNEVSTLSDEKEELIIDKEHLGDLLETARYEIDSKDLSILKHLDDISEYKQILSDFETLKDELALIDYQKTLLEETIKDREDQIAFLQDNLLNINDLRSLLETQQPQEIPVLTESKPSDTDNSSRYITIIGFVVLLIIQLACFYVVMRKNSSHLRDVNFLRDAYQKDLSSKDYQFDD
jgi:hypothetical protein